jgi:spore coat protein H
VLRPAVLIRVLVSLLAVARAAPALAQSHDDLFTAGTIHAIQITMHSGDWERLRANAAENDDYPADLTWNGVRTRNVAVRSRGLGSRNGAKPSLELTFDRYAVRQRFLGVRGLVLDSLSTDPSMMRERVAFARLGLPAPRATHVQVFVNGDDAGLYALVERIDSVFGEGTFGAAGTLFEYRWNGPFYATFPGDDLGPYRTLFEARDASGRSTYDLYAPVRDLFRTINEASDATFRADVGALLDLDAFIRLVAADVVLAEWDGFLGYAGMNNVYLHRGDGPARFLPWDKDQTFRAADYPVLAGAADNILMRRVLADPALRATFLSALTDSAQAAASGNWLVEEVERQYAQVRAAAIADVTKPFTNAEFEAEIAFLRSFARTRPGFVLHEAQRLR